MEDKSRTTEELQKELQELRQSYDALKLSADKNRAEQKQLKKALQQSETNLRLLAQHSTDVIWTMDNNYRFTYISPSVARLRGL